MGSISRQKIINPPLLILLVFEFGPKKRSNCGGCGKISIKNTRRERRDKEKYEKAQDAKSIRESYFLVNVVDNDYTNSQATIFDIFNRVITQMMSKRTAEAVEKVENENNELTRQMDGMKRLQLSTAADYRNNEENLQLKKMIIKLQKELRDEKAKQYL